jgi:uncharacterized protein YjbI with pentapeptide repeats
VLFGQMSFMNARHSPAQDAPQNQQGQAERLANLRFVRDRSSAVYQPRPFRQFDLAGTDLADLVLNGANFVEADLSKANLTGTDLSSKTKATPATPGTPATPAAYTFLQGVNLCHAALTGTNLRSTFLVNTNLTGVDLTSTQLQGAVLNGSDLSEATLPSDVTSKDSLLAASTTTTTPFGLKTFNRLHLWPVIPSLHSRQAAGQSRLASTRPPASRA